MRVAMVKRALDDAPHCGDECGYWPGDDKTTLCVVDGLGHGPDAERAARAAVDYVARHLSEPLADIFAGCNVALHRTRGVAMGLAVVEEGVGRLTYAGIGNTRAMIVGERTVHLSSNWGIVGGGYRTLSPETVPLVPGDLVILSTDGVAEMIDLSAYDDELRADVQGLAERIVRDWGRETDDVAVLVFRSEVR